MSEKDFLVSEVGKFPDKSILLFSYCTLLNRIDDMLLRKPVAAVTDITTKRTIELYI